jgi:low affinity iron permease
MPPFLAGQRSGFLFSVGGPTAFIAGGVMIVIWGAAGPMFGYSDRWQLVTRISIRLRSPESISGRQGTRERGDVNPNCLKRVRERISEGRIVRALAADVLEPSLAFLDSGGPPFALTFPAAARVGYGTELADLRL